MMETQRYYLPVSSGSLPHYLGKAIILPARYYDNKPRDVQDNLKDCLILSSQKWSAGEECSIEVTLTNSEQTALRAQNDGTPFYLYNNGVPISRIAAIHFKDRKQSETTQWNINSVTAFLPDHLISIDPGAGSDGGVPFTLSKDGGLAIQDLAEKAKRFDILLGGLAFMKVAARPPATFPKDYFAVLAHFNARVKTELHKAAERKLVTFDDQLTSVFTSKKSAWTDVQPMIFDEVSTATVEAAARKAKVSLEKKYGMIELDKLSSVPNLYILALLATYGSNKPKNLQDLISGVIGSGSVTEEKAEEIALVFGLNTRYSGLRNAYNGKAMPIKFKLTSQLDYYTIESIYQYTFCSQKESGDYDYIDAIIGKAPAPPQPRDEVGFWILDTPVIVKKKKDLEEELLGTLRDAYPALHDILERAARRGIQAASSELEAKDQQIQKLQTLLKAKETELLDKSMPPRVPSPSVQAADDGLEQLDFKALKAMAKSRKVPAKAYQDLKQTQQGFSELIALIRGHQTLL